METTEVGFRREPNAGATVLEVAAGTPRPAIALAHYRREFPELWRAAQYVADMRWKAAAVDWPESCYLPAAAAHAATVRTLCNGTKPPGFPDEAAIHKVLDDHPLGTWGPILLAALAAWRMAKGLYRFDADVLEAVWESGLRGHVPAEALSRMPEWCPYVELPCGFDPGLEAFAGLRGFWVFLDWDGPRQPRALSFVLDRGEPIPHQETDDPSEIVERQMRFEPVVLPLTGRGVGESVDAYVDESIAHTERMRGAETASQLRDCAGEVKVRQREMLGPLVSTALYLCAANAEVEAADGSGREPSNPRPCRTKKGTRVFAAPDVAAWNVGHRVGAALRNGHKGVRGAESGDGEADDGAARRRPRAHARRAHFRYQPVGPRREGRRELRWIHLAFVNLRDGHDLPTVIRPVERDEGRLMRERLVAGVGQRPLSPERPEDGQAGERGNTGRSKE